MTGIYFYCFYCYYFVEPAPAESNFVLEPLEISADFQPSVIFSPGGIETMVLSGGKIYIKKGSLVEVDDLENLPN